MLSFFQSVAAKKNGIVIERGPVGRYQLLPEAETEMVPISVRYYATWTAVNLALKYNNRMHSREILTDCSCASPRPPRAPRSSTRERYESHNGGRGGGMANGGERESNSYKRRSRSMESFGFNNVNTRYRKNTKMVTRRITLSTINSIRLFSTQQQIDVDSRSPEPRPDLNHEPNWAADKKHVQGGLTL